MFENKPEGDVLTYTAHDEKGTPIEPMQDPLLYPMGTGYLAPGRCRTSWWAQLVAFLSD